MDSKFVDAHSMLAVPRLHTRTKAQAEGRTCVWCGGAAHDSLGPRLSTHGGLLERWKPRACHPCIRREAARVYQLHVGACARCLPRAYCPDARALHALSTQAPAPEATPFPR